MLSYLLFTGHAMQKYRYHVLNWTYRNLVLNYHCRLQDEGKYVVRGDTSYSKKKISNLGQSFDPLRKQVPKDSAT